MKQGLSFRSPTSVFWFTLFQLETLLVKYVLSIREDNFKLFNLSLCDIILWMFALDHIHYTRWLTELLPLRVEDRKTFEIFISRCFAINKSRRTFLKLLIDQGGNNKLFKVDRGATGTLKNEVRLLNGLLQDQS